MSQKDKNIVGFQNQIMEWEGEHCLRCLSNKMSSWQLHMAPFKFSTQLALQRFLLIPGELSAEGGIAYHM